MTDAGSTPATSTIFYYFFFLKGLIISMGIKIKIVKSPCNLELDEAEGKKDACYHKVKANSKEWPSAYASGRLVQCREKGASNWLSLIHI